MGTFAVTEHFYLAPGREADQIVAAKMGDLRTLSYARKKKAQWAPAISCPAPVSCHLLPTQIMP